MSPPRAEGSAVAGRSPDQVRHHRHGGAAALDLAAVAGLSAALVTAVVIGGGGPLLIAGVYVCVLLILLILLRTPLRPALRFLFAPLGRMALTHYLTAALLVLEAAHVLGLPIGQSPSVAFQAARVILAAQWLFSVLWLRRYRQGPLERLWRWVTWARRPTLRIVR